VCGVVIAFAAALPTGVLGPFLVLLAAGIIGAVLLRLRGGGERSVRAGEDLPHPGPNVSQIPLAGLPGAVFALGFVWVFWFGAPGLRPLVLVAGGLGVPGGAVLVLLGRRHRTPTSTPLGLHSERRAADPGATDKGSE